jgi:hypothetical protein
MNAQPSAPPAKKLVWALFDVSTSGAPDHAGGSSRFSIHAAAVDLCSNVWLSPSQIPFCASQAMVPFLRRRLISIPMIYNMVF